MTAEIGTAKNTPTNPNNAPPKITTEIIQSGDNPTESPIILGPITFPSSCCNKKIKRATQMARTGSAIKVIPIGRIAPTIGPK